MAVVVFICVLSLLPGFAVSGRYPAEESLELQSFGLTSLASGMVRLGRSSPTLSEVTHLELLVVVGADVQQVHRQDTERYILTNLNIASELLRDTSLGANLRIHLVRTIILTEPEPDIQITGNITSSLISVCEWGRRVNPVSDTDPLHADLLLYITRFDLQLPDRNKQVRGVAQLGGACTSQWSCVITEDTGFDLGITIAHEIGHSFGINHDGTGNSCGSGGFIMAADGGYGSTDLTWSQCSREQLSRFFSAGHADCVRDLPVFGGSLQDWKPGLYYGVDDQCRIAFGSVARACSFRSGDVDACRVLSCHTVPGDQSSCTRLLVPLLDGTECAPNQWCMKGRCVSPSQLSASMVVHGSWSGWTEFSPCSRTCGGGVSARRRHCNNPRPAFGGNNCEGTDTEARLCNTQPCRGSQLDFMKEQCSMTDSQPLRLSPTSASLYHWVPAVGHVTGDLQCRLLCRSQGEDFMVSRGPQFLDGTRCEPNSPPPPGSVPACLGGKCQLFGCDGVLHSTKVEDACGVCGGNGSSCILISASYTEGRAKEYITFLTLPQNATRVQIVNTRPLFTHLAVLVRGKYVVAGGGRVSLNATHPSPLEDDQLTYRLYLTPDLLPDKEEVLLHGPVTEETCVQVYRKYGKEYGEATSPSISYSFFLPRNSSSIRAKWQTHPTSCSVTCGSGLQQSTVVCQDINTGDTLADSLCGGDPRPPGLRTPCHLLPCPPEWETGAFGPCSASCGTGEMVRPVRCVQMKGEERVERPASECPQNWVPLAISTCNTVPCPVRWRVSEPGECSAVCGPGEAWRAVTCVRTERDVDSHVDDTLCLQSERPPSTVPCVVNICPVGWETEAEVQGKYKMVLAMAPPPRAEPVYVWSPMIGQCSKSCGMGQQHIWYTCVDHSSTQQVLEVYCNGSSKPEPYTELCNLTACPPTWRYQQGACSATCGGGLAHQVSYCSRDTELGGEEIVSDSECAEPRPSERVLCNPEPCPARWRVQEVGSCSASCGLGVSRRRVSCVRFEQGAERELTEDHCPPNHRPAATQPCLVLVCTFRWEVQDWSQCSVTCGNGVQSRAVSCVGPGQPQHLSPLLCMHLPKPITIQACHPHHCVTPAPDPPKATAQPSTPESLPTGLAHPTPGDQVTGVVSSSTPEVTAQLTTPPPAPTVPTQTSPCGQLLLQESGQVNLSGGTSRDCILTIGRPLDEVVRVTVEFSSLDCPSREFVAFYDRLMLVKKCERVSGFTITSHTNVLLVRQGLVTAGNGVLLTYRSLKSSKKGLYRDCDQQLFGPAGKIVNPTRLAAPSGQACRVFINTQPSTRIEIRALSIEPALEGIATQSTFILVSGILWRETLRCPPSKYSAPLCPSPDPGRQGDEDHRFPWQPAVPVALCWQCCGN
uniref:ADAM metallopeptidase with thrombospondin type 1 motif 13 n=1 Tax=Paramormyrops kingsleyae TaxID=1676925 RepID=A0A3B3QV97_9TELE